ncbi:glycosyltransferase family 4 protein [Litorisediminicola beolgyonensis]|uniref:Glycosyltransferase family 4 protein n=1 Tax=Litorisediminicola beolgyonensis TaxID=1173614 RepID=A0ABW3ZJ76_9RHOB
MARPKVLVIAEAANPEWVSVPLVGWSMSQALGEVADTHVVTHLRNRDAFLRAGQVEGRDFTAIDSDAIAKPLWKLSEWLRMGEGKGWTLVTALSSLSYPYFERLVWQRFGAQIARGNWDIVHRVTPLSPTAPSPLAPRISRAGVPFVIGPLNGGVPWPAGFDAERRAEREWLTNLRSVYKILPGRNATLDHASAILAGSRHTASEIPERLASKLVWLPENGIDPARFNRRAAPPSPGEPLRAVFVGRLVPYKGPDMALEAAAPLIESGRMSLDIVGDGPMRALLEAQAARFGTSVRFHGWRPHKEVQDIMAKAHILLFPSIREFGGGVVLEAMALGLPPLVVEYGGPAELVTPETGFTVPCSDRAGIVADVRARLTALAEDPSPLCPIGDAARQRVAQSFTWSAKARQVRQVYDWVLSGTDGPAPRPID